MRLLKLKKLYALGFEYERKNGNCAQCTLAALLDFLGTKSENLFKAATALCGGTADMGDGNCGGYSGGALVLGLLYGRERKDFSDRDKTDRANKLARKLRARFIEEYGGVTCQDVQRKVFGRAFDSQDPEDNKVWEEAGGPTDKCPSVVGKAACWTYEIILAENANMKP
jgi:C_GCAxxG_C_C family probable redox protein